MKIYIIEQKIIIYILIKHDHNIYRLNCESDTTPNTTPEERRRKAQTDVKATTSINKQQSYQRGRTSSVSAFNKDALKASEPSKSRTPSISRNDACRVCIRAPKSSYVSLKVKK